MSAARTDRAGPRLPLDAGGCYAALKARDTRFDGRFFVAVSSTGIYCRPVCGVRAPRPENCAFFPSAAAAEAGGYRPCLRCRPELAPGYAIIDASAAIARRAASLIEDGTMSAIDAPALARRLGVTDRHLRRVFGAEFGVSPVQYAQTQRLLLAKRLLTDTAIPVTEVALASGFASVRRFNALFRERYRMAPSRLRAAPDAGARGERAPTALRFELAYRPPYDWDGVLGFLAQRTVAGVEAVTAHAYRRVVRVDAPAGAPFGEAVGWIEVEHRARRRTLQVSVSAGLARVVPQVLARVKRLFDTDCRPDEIAAVLGEFAAGRPGVRVPGAFDGFEMAVRAILGQQVSVRAAHTLAGRVAQRFGQPVETGIDGLHTAFPSAARFARLSVDDVASLGIVAQRARALLALAGAMHERRVVLEAGADVDATIAALKSLPGIGDWTAQYVAMRALSWPDAFPASDLGVLKALGVSGARQAQALSQRWRPWRAYAVMVLWRSLQPAPAGVVPEGVVPARPASGGGARRRAKAPA